MDFLCVQFQFTTKQKILMKIIHQREMDLSELH